jgi:hypothetical protein
MSPTSKKPLELEAALAVIEWKHEFAKQLRLEAVQLAGNSQRTVTVSQLRAALPSAFQAMLAVISKKTLGTADDESKAA